MSSEELALTGSLLDIVINTDGNVLVLSDIQLTFIGLPNEKNKGINFIELHEEGDSLFQSRKPDPGPKSPKRCWWIPSFDIVESVLVLRNDGQFKLFSHDKGSMRFNPNNPFCQHLSEMLRNYKQQGQSLEFVDLNFTGFISCHMTHGSKQKEPDYSPLSNTVSTKIYSVMDETIPKKYKLGHFVHQRKKRKYHRKRHKSVDSIAEKVPEEIHSSEDEMEQNLKPSVQHIIRTSDSGAKRLVTYVLDGKDGIEHEEKVEEEDEKVLCVCGADEEDSSADEEWVQCDLCKTWQHVECVDYFPELQDFFHCDNCIKKGGSAEKTNSEPNKKPTKGKERLTEKSVAKEVDASCDSIKKIITSPVQHDSDMSSKSDQEDTDSESSHGILHKGNHINCPCGAEDSESGEEWVQCDECDKWQHQACVNYGAENESKYQCPSCKQILTYFSNDFKALPKGGSSSKSSYRIPKLSKAIKDAYQVVGHSSFSSKDSKYTLQPVYLPKSIDSMVSILRKCAITEHSGKEDKKVSGHRNSTLTAGGSSGSPSLGETASDETLNEASNAPAFGLVNGRSEESDNCKLEQSQYVFCFIVFTELLVILKRCDNSTFDLASVIEFDGRKVHTMALKSDCKNLEHSLALVDYDSNDILVWKFKFSNDVELLSCKENYTIPTLNCVKKTTVQIKDLEFIERVLWLNDTAIIVQNLSCIMCYSLDSATVVWKLDNPFHYIIDLSFVGNDLFLCNDSGDSILVDISNGRVVREERSDRKDILVASKFSPSSLLKYEISVCATPTYEFNTPLTFKILLNPFHEISRTEYTDQHCSLGEEMYLTSKFGIIFKKLDDQTENGHQNKPDIDTICPVCDTKSITTVGKYEVKCANSHHIFIDPTSGKVIDLFSARICARCDVTNSSEAEVCGSCSCSHLTPL